MASGPSRGSRAKRTMPGRSCFPQAALDVIRVAAPDRLESLRLCRSRGGAFHQLGRGQAALDAKLPADMPGWVIHDLRRTARSLMSRAGVRPDIAERVLGHAIAGVEGVYDRHSYREEKADALQRLAALVETIVNPPAANVVPLRGTAR